MLKDLFQFKCPCCGKLVEVDTRSGAARAVKVEDLGAGKNLDSLLEESKRDAERLDSFFHRAKDQQKRQGEHLDKLFGDAIEDAKRDPDKKKPKNPFDLE